MPVNTNVFANALWKSLAQTAETIRVRADGKTSARDRFQRVVPADNHDSETEAWEKAEHILHVATGRAAQRRGFKAKPDGVGAQRLRATAAQGKVVG